MIDMVNKEEGDRIILDYLVFLTKKNDRKESAEESIKIMENLSDSQFLLSLILIDGLTKSGLMPQQAIDLEVNILSALSSMFTTCNSEDIPEVFRKTFSGTDDEVIENVRNNKKLMFAVRSFVGSYYTYDAFEKKYPEISKSI